VMRLPEELVPPDPVLRAEADASWADGLATLRRVAADPAGEVRAAKAAREARPRGAPILLEFTPDMPGPDGSAGGRALTDDELEQLVVPAPPSLAHDAAWFDAVDQAKPHAALLRQLRPRWRSRS
jgi:hypothetical protein